MHSQCLHRLDYVSISRIIVISFAYRAINQLKRGYVFAVVIARRSRERSPCLLGGRNLGDLKFDSLIFKSCQPCRNEHVHPAKHSSCHAMYGGGTPLKTLQ